MKQIKEYILEKLKLTKDNSKHDDGNMPFIDFDLPSGTEWAAYNLGVDPDKVDDSKYDWGGNMYSWGETEPKNSISKFTINNYKFYFNGKITKYKNNERLEPEDDAACKINKKWSVPTKEQMEELVNNVDFKYVQGYKGIKNLNGVLFYKDDLELFIPGSGLVDGNDVLAINDAWTWLKDSKNEKNAWAFKCDVDDHHFFETPKQYGLPIRPVK